MDTTINIRLHIEGNDYLIAIAANDLSPLPASVQTALTDLGCEPIEGFTSTIGDELVHPNVFVFPSTEEFWFPIATEIMESIQEAAPDATVNDLTDETA